MVEQIFLSSQVKRSVIISNLLPKWKVFTWITELFPQCAILPHPFQSPPEAPREWLTPERASRLQHAPDPLKLDLFDSPCNPKPLTQL